MRHSIICLVSVLLVSSTAHSEEAKPYAAIALEGDHRWISYFAFSGDGKVFAVSHRGSIYKPSFVSLFDAASGKLLRRVDGPEGTLLYFAVALSSDGKRLAVGGTREIRIIDAESGKLLHQITNPWVVPYLYVRHLAFSPDGLTLASCGLDKRVILWDVKTGRKTNTLWHDRKLVFYVAFSSDGKKVTALGLDINEDEYATDWLVQVWDRATSKELSRVAGKAGETFSHPYLSPHGEMAVFRRLTNPLEVWDVSSGKLTSVIKGEGEGFAYGFELSPDNKSLVTFSYKENTPTAKQRCRLERWDVKTGKNLGSIEIPKFIGTDFKQSRKGNRIAFQDDESTIKLWSAGKLLPAVKKDERGEEKPAKP